MRRRHAIIVFVVIAFAGLSIADHAGVFGAQGPDRTRYHGVIATVVHAADGDTLDVDIPDGRRNRTRIRLWGVDCPEIAHGKGEADAYFGPEAAAFVRAQVVGRRVKLVLDPIHPPRDKYGRLLAYVYLVDAAGNPIAGLEGKAARESNAGRDGNAGREGAASRDAAARAKLAGELSANDGANDAVFSPPEGESLNQWLIERGLAYADFRFEHVHEIRFERAERTARKAKAGLWAGVREAQMPEWRRRMDAARKK